MINDFILPAGLELRTAQAEDDRFMEQLFSSTREFLYSMPMPKQYVDVLIGQQYQLQKTSYRQQAPQAVVLIIQLQGKPVGKIIINKNNNVFHIIDCVLMPEVRGQGYGSTVFRAIQAAAAQQKMSITLSVDRQNFLAKKLYFSLGFRALEFRVNVSGIQMNEASDTHESMSWSPV